MADTTAEAQSVHSNAEKVDGFTVEPAQDSAHVPNSGASHEETERKARVDAVWQQMNRGISKEKLNSVLNKPISTANRPSRKASQASSTSWMTYLGLEPKKIASHGRGMPEKRPSITQNGASDETMRLAASALSAVKDTASVAVASGSGKIEISEVHDFAGQEVEIKKLIEANSKEAAKLPGSAVDAVLEHIKKKPKLSVLNKTKKDWGEFKEENKGLEEELDAYKKSGNQYLDKVSFLQRADYREFERERDVRLALQAKRKPDM